MNYLNDLNHPQVQKVLKKQSDYIDKKLPKSKLRYFKIKGNYSDTEKEIIKFFNFGIAQNLIRDFFKFSKEDQYCFHCYKKKEECRQLDRAHCNAGNVKNGSRPRDKALSNALNKLCPNPEINDEGQEIFSVKTDDFLKEFILQHKTIPLYYLCKSCHNEYDAIIIN